MYWLADSWDAIIDFLYLGGNVLRWIAITIFLMWVLIIERLMFFRSTMSAISQKATAFDFFKNGWSLTSTSHKSLSKRLSALSLELQIDAISCCAGDKN